MHAAASQTRHAIHTSHTVNSGTCRCTGTVPTNLGGQTCVSSKTSLGRQTRVSSEQSLGDSLHRSRDDTARI